MAPPSENRRALRSHPCVALSSRYPGKAITGYTIFHDWTIVENSIVLDMGSTLIKVGRVFSVLAAYTVGQENRYARSSARSLLPGRMRSAGKSFNGLVNFYKAGKPQIAWHVVRMLKANDCKGQTDFL